MMENTAQTEPRTVHTKPRSESIDHHDLALDTLKQLTDCRICAALSTEL